MDTAALETISADSQDSHSEIDSALGTDRGALKKSLRSSLLESVQGNGRSYHRNTGIAGTQYHLPEDELEQNRSDLHHQIFLDTFHGKLHLSSLGDHVCTQRAGSWHGYWYLGEPAVTATCLVADADVDVARL